jgi:hypothetical protein
MIRLAARCVLAPLPPELHPVEDGGVFFVNNVTTDHGT